MTREEKLIILYKNCLRDNYTDMSDETHQLKAKVFAMDFHSFLAMNTVDFDIAFVDPPYKTGLLQEALELVAENMKDTGVIIAENPLDEQISAQYGDFLLDREYRYGKIKISTFRHKDFL